MKMQTNDRLHRAKRAKDDEFYTPREYVEELLPYLEQFRNANILCPCDSAESFYYIVLKENGFNVKRSNADFRLNAGLLPYNGKAIAKGEWEWADLIVTNPPFSLAREFIKQCLATGKKFILLVNFLTFFKCAGFNKDYFLLSGIRFHDRIFTRPDGTQKKIAYCEYIQNTFGRLPIKGYNPPIYSNEYNLGYMETKRGAMPCISGGALPIPGTLKEPFLTPLSALYRLDENDYILTGFEKMPYLDGKRQFSKIVLQWKGMNNVCKIPN